MIVDRMTINLITEVMDVMDRHGYVPGDNQHVAQAAGTIIDLARIYQGTPDRPSGPPIIHEPASLQPAPEPPARADPDAVIASASEVRTLLAALDDAAEDKRDRADTCADRSCDTCQWPLQTAADDEPPVPPARAHLEAGKEAGQ